MGRNMISTTSPHRCNQRSICTYQMKVFNRTVMWSFFKFFVETMEINCMTVNYICHSTKIYHTKYTCVECNIHRYIDTGKWKRNDNDYLYVWLKKRKSNRRRVIARRKLHLQGHFLRRVGNSAKSVLIHQLTCSHPMCKGRILITSKEADGTASVREVQGGNNLKLHVIL